MITIKKSIQKKILTLSLSGIACSCNKQYQNEKGKELIFIQSITKTSNSCSPLNEDKISQEESLEKDKIVLFFQNSISADEKESLKETLNQYYSRKEKDVEPIANLLSHLEELMHKYHDILNKQSIKSLFNIEEYINKTSDIYIDTVKKVNKSNNSSLIKYKKEPVFGALNNTDFSIEKYLITLESEDKAAQFNNTIKKYITLHNLDENFIPFPDSIKTNSIKLINIKSGEIKIIALENIDDFIKLNDFKKYINENINNLSFYVKKDSSGNLHLQDINSMHSLSAGLGIKTIIDYFSNHRKDILFSSRSDETNLSKMLKIHTFINIAQAGFDDLTEIEKIHHIFRTLNSTALEDNINFFNAISKVGAKISLGLNTTNIVLDAIELANAESATQKIKFGTELSFDSAGLSLGVGSSILNLVGASTASAALSTMAVPFTGLAIGFNAFANASAHAQEQSVNLASYFYHYEQEIKKYKSSPSYESAFQNEIKNLPFVPLAYKNNQFINNKLQSASFNNVMIKGLDLRTANNMTLHFGDHYVYQTSRYDSLDTISHTYLSSFGPNPAPIINNQHLLPIKNLLNFSLGNEDSVVLNNIKSEKPIILPVVPTTDISYSFHYTPGILARHDAELSSVLKMQRNGKFLFEYMTGIFAEFAIRELFFDYKKTDISIYLAENSRFLYTPKIPEKWNNLITYNLFGNNGHYFLKIDKEAHYNIHTLGDNDKWIFDISTLTEKIIIEKNSIKADSFQINFLTFKKPKEILLLHKLGEITSVQLDEEKQTYTLFDFNKLALNLAQFKKMLQSRVLENKQEHGFIEIENYPIFENHSGKVWYDIKNNQIININNLKSLGETQGDYTQENTLSLVSRIGNQLYFYDKNNYKLYYQKDLTSNIYLLEDNIENITFFLDHLIIEKKDGFVISVKNPQDKTLLEIKKDDLKKEMILKIAKKKRYKLNNEILLFNQNNKFYAWYLTHIDLIVDIKKINNHIEAPHL
ncbi:TcdA/TcdB pore-forming domain-containing protein [Fluviispira multicolorata]|uniref:TcdA/TcdB toxin pore forming domain-containing protein n=1 Tax=Fluviispira multicolorata TaxID=2654512 RepID=A0A833JBT2_9BACT|nr:TcdA/TcdB pore-forming domain-containing protein [Fluviispira multicolorata]KAB8029811.1 hypothetical protein GCL57_09740 [Fluviispira multicolorata]